MTPTARTSRPCVASAMTSTTGYEALLAELTGTDSPLS